VENIASSVLDSQERADGRSGIGHWPRDRMSIADAILTNTSPNHFLIFIGCKRTR